MILMKFVSVRDLRSRSAQIWSELSKENNMVITSNGKPMAIITSVSEDTLDESLYAIRQARAIAAVTSMQLSSIKKGTDKISVNEIDAEIKAVRKGHSR